MYKLWRDISLQSRARYKGSGGKEARKVEKKQRETRAGREEESWGTWVRSVRRDRERRQGAVLPGTLLALPPPPAPEGAKALFAL